MAEKAILLILDGLGDLPAPKKTPLEMAKKPNMDKLAKTGIQGMMATIGQGIVPGSDTAHLQILGYALGKYYPGRGPFEALGCGISLKPGDITFRANFSTVNGNEITDRRAGRISSEDAKKLEADVNFKIDDVEVIFRSSVEHRGALVLRGKGLSCNISATDPHCLGKVLDSVPLDSTPEAKKTAEVLNKFTRMIGQKLEKNEANLKRKARNLPQANMVLLRGGGAFCAVPSFSQRFGIKGVCIAGGALYKGVASFIGMDIISVPGATGAKDTNLKAKGLATQKALEKYDFVFLHVKATDSFAHDGDAKGKTAFIEKIDKELIPLLVESGAALIITGDHTTSCVRKDHTGYDVPVLIHEKGGRTDGIGKFSESSAMKGGLGHINGADIIPIMLNMIGKAKMYGS